MNNKSGYSGRDSMRDKAIRAFGKTEMHCASDITKNRVGPKTPKLHIPKGRINHDRHLDRDTVGHKPVRRNMGGPMNTANSIQQANELLSNASASRLGIKHGGRVHHKAEGGEVVRKAIGGVGKIRHGQSTRTGAQIAPRGRHNGKS